MELLSPAGNFTALIGAVNAGADAVYIGGSKYGARAYAENFSDEEILKAISYTHLHGVKLYLTVNTLIKEREWDDCLSYIRPFYEAGLDALIVQDIGLISVFRQEFPNMECHISTQGFSTGLESVRYYKSFGATRVVLARELSLEEIKYIKANEDIEIETFVHGAMCYSYSGECLFSSCLGGRSGNRGRCAGPCRLPYSYVDSKGREGKECFFLSMKDQCTLEILPQIIEAGVDSLKIEGRMKKPVYSAFVTAMYRKYIDLYKKNPSAYKVDIDDIEAIKHVYLRSEISDGYYSTYSGRSMITMSDPAYTPSDERLLLKTEKEFLSGPEKIPVSIAFFAKPGEKMTLLLSDSNGNSVSVEGDSVEASLTRPAVESDVMNRISKFGDSYFIPFDISVDISGDCFLPVKSLNEIRRIAIEKLSEVILENYRCNNPVKTGIVAPAFRKKVIFDKKPIVSVSTYEQYEMIKKYADRCYVACTYDIASLIKEHGDNEILVLPDVIRKKDYEYVRLATEYARKYSKGIIASNTEAVSYVMKSGFSGFIILGNGIYIFNRAALSYAESLFDDYIIPYELSSHEIDDLNSESGYLAVYGKIPLMHSANCIAKTNEGCIMNKTGRFSYIKDRTGTYFPVLRNCSTCSNIIFNSVPTYIKDKVSHTPLISFTDESEEETERILSFFFDNSAEGPSLYTKAYWKRGIE